MTEDANSPTPTRLKMRELLELEARVTELRKSIGLDAWDGTPPSNHHEKPSRAILIGDKVAGGACGEGFVIGYHRRRLVVAFLPSHHESGDLYLVERAPENIAKHEELMRLR